MSEETDYYIVEVEVTGTWIERYEVKATSEDEASDNWSDGEYLEAYNYNPYDYQPFQTYWVRENNYGN